MHALNHPDLQAENLYVMTASPNLIKSLLPENAKIIELTPGQGDKPGAICEKKLTDIINKHAGSLPRIDQIIHAFIGDEDPHPFENCKLVRLGTYDVKRRRIDSSTKDKSYMFHDHWNPPEIPISSENYIAATIREMKTRPELNTPKWFKEALRTLARELKWKIIWYGKKHKTDFDLNDDELSLPYNRFDFKSQIKQIRANAKCAIGWNSGGLDLAAAAGIPILRFGEYQMKSSRNKIRCCLKWGKHYNSYLACSANIGIEPEVENTEEFSKVKFEKFVRLFINNIELLTNLKEHVIIPFNINELSIDDVLKHRIQWPGE